MDDPPSKGAYNSGHHDDSEALRRVRESIRREVAPPSPPPPSFGWTARQSLVLGIILALLSAWAAAGVAQGWEMSVPAAWLIMVGGLMVVAGSLWKTVLVWDDMPYGHGGGLYNYYFVPFRFFYALAIFSDFERFKPPLILMAKGVGVALLGFLLDALLSGPPA